MNYELLETAAETNRQVKLSAVSRAGNQVERVGYVEELSDTHVLLALTDRDTPQKRKVIISTIVGEVELL
jgi:hypothetical protein